MSYKNPILHGFNPDPSICFDDDKYVMVCSSFEYFPGIPIYTSYDLVNWERSGYVLTDSNCINLKSIKNSQGLFAPTIRFYEGTYFVVCTNINEGNFICSTTDLKNGWSNPTWIDTPRGIDPSLIFDKGKCYYQLTVFKDKNSIIQFEIDPTTGTRLSPIININKGCGGRDVEAPHIFKKDDWYYLVLAEGGTREGHMVTIQRSKDIYGPFEACPRNPILSNRDVKKSLQSVGHGDFIEDKNGKWWIVSLATRPIQHRTLLGRETILLPVEWEDGWPLVNKTGHADLYIQTNRLVCNLVNQVFTENRFSPESFRFLALEPEWNSDKSTLSIVNENEELRIPNKKPVSFISVSQEDYYFDFTTEIRRPTFDGKLGIAIYKDDNHYAEFGVSSESNTYSIYSMVTVSDLKVEKNQSIDSVDNLKINVKGDESCYRIRITSDNHSFAFSIATRHFTKEVSDSQFTGVQIGLFSRSKNGIAMFNNTRLHYEQKEQNQNN